MTRVVVSLTTPSHREEVAYFAVLSVLAQSRPPDRVVVYLSDTPTLRDRGFQDEPFWSRWVDRDKVVFRWGENLGPYGKLLPAFNHDIGAGDLLVTVDDDILYGHHWLATLLGDYRPDEPNIVCARARLPRAGYFGRLRSYRDWPLIDTPITSQEALPTGVYGAVYRRDLVDAAFLNDPAFKDIAPTADDLWLKAASALKGVGVRAVPASGSHCYPIRTDVSLMQHNLKRRPGAAWERLLPVSRRKRERWRSALGWPVVTNDVIMARIRAYAHAQYGLVDPYRAPRGT